MKRFIKYGVVPVATFLSLLSVTIMVLPIVMNVDKYLPVIEEKLSDATGRPVTIGSSLGLSFFPWLSVSFSDLQIGNPEGFPENGFIKIESFETRLKLLPLLTGDVEVSRFIVGGLEVNLEQREDGAVNWDLSRMTRGGEILPTGLAGMSSWDLPDNFSVALLAVTDGAVNWHDSARKVSRRFDHLMLLVNDFTVDKPVAVELKIAMEGKALMAEGRIGPFLGKKPGQGVLPLDLAVVLGKRFSGKLKGELTNLFEKPGYDFHLQTDRFSGQEFLVYLGLDIPGITTDPAGANSLPPVTVELRAKGDNETLTIEKSKINFDNSQLAVGLMLKDFDQPKLVFSADIDRFNLDQYLTAGPDTVSFLKSFEQNNGEGSWLDGLRSMKMTGAIQIQQFVVAGGTISDLDIHLRGVDGVFSVDPATFTLYQGVAEANFVINLQNNFPKTSMDLKLQKVRVNPLLHDFVGKDFLSGNLTGDMHLLFSGWDSMAVKDSLVADGRLTIKDGMFVGIDLLHAVRNVVHFAADTTLDSQAVPQKNRTDFSEFASKFSVKNGVLSTNETSLIAADARLQISGIADFFKEQLQLEFRPAVATLIAQEEAKGQLEDVDKVVPYEISGAFAKPNIDIAAQYLPLEQLNLSDELDMQILVEEKLPSPVEEDVRDLVGTSLIDPTVVAQRFDLQPELLRQTQRKKLLKKGSGKVLIRPLKEQEAWQK